MTSAESVPSTSGGSGADAVSTAAGQSWQERVSKKQQSAHEKIPKEWLIPTASLKELDFPLESNNNNLLSTGFVKTLGILSDRELNITEDYDVPSLISALASGKITAVEVTVAFSKRAAIAQQLTNCLTETYFDEALARATQLDELRAQGTSAGPLHGLPISLKDSFRIKGSESTIGFVSHLGTIAESNSCLVDVLLELGAVLYVKTNIPQTMMTCDSHNNIFGRTLNPHNTALGAGGSSGGEGALVAFRGSPLGIGTDIAGSIRIPALCDGTYGFKPTANRIPFGRQTSPYKPGGVFFEPCAGPLANDIEALEVLTKAVIGTQPARFDSTAIDVPWRNLEKLPAGKLRLGLITEDPVIPLHPPIRRTINEAAKLLAAQGHDIIPIPPEECHILTCAEVGIGFFDIRSASSAENIMASGEPPVPSLIAIGKSGEAVKGPFFQEIAELTDIPRLDALSVKRYLLKELWRENWNKYKVDAIICPSAQYTAMPHDQFLMPAYTLFLNTLNYPACVIPVGKASMQLDPTPTILQAGQFGAPYDPETTDGAPCSIQIFTSSMRDEECLQAARVVDMCVNGK